MTTLSHVYRKKRGKTRIQLMLIFEAFLFEISIYTPAPPSRSHPLSPLRPHTYSSDAPLFTFSRGVHIAYDVLSNPTDSIVVLIYGLLYLIACVLIEASFLFWSYNHLCMFILRRNYKKVSMGHGSLNIKFF